MMKRRLRFGLRAVQVAPGILVFITDNRVGDSYGISAAAKVRLLVRFAINSRGIETLSTMREHTELARAILSVPAKTPGIVVECGCHLGGSAVNLSLACALAGRPLLICDSFEALPAPQGHDRAHHNPFTDHIDRYQEGRFGAPLETVEANIRTTAISLSMCGFCERFFETGLAGLDEDIVLAFLDVDLVDSLKPCLRELWPKMSAGRRMYVDEAQSLSLIAVFLIRSWWLSTWGSMRPGSSAPVRACLWPRSPGPNWALH